MKLVEKTSHTNVVDPKELVKDQLLRELHGEVLLIRSSQGIILCKRSAENLRQRSLSWLLKADTEKACFIAGHISKKGGRFQIITRDKAVGLIATWIFKDLQYGKSYPTQKTRLGLNPRTDRVFRKVS